MSNDGSNHVKEANVALRRLKDGKSLLTSISKTLDDAIKKVTDDTSNAYRGSGLSLLPDDVLTYIFEMYVESGIAAYEQVV